MTEGAYAECPRCHNTGVGTRILQCGDCGALFCSACKLPVVFSACPECKVSGFSAIFSCLGAITEAAQRYRINSQNPFTR